MSPVSLSDEEWDAIKADLPDTSSAYNRHALWPRIEDICISESSELLKRLQLSNVCFRDAGDNLANAQYALAQAVGARKYYLEQSKSPGDNARSLADLRSRFYADYVPLLLWSVGEHACNGLEKLFALSPHGGKRQYKLKRVRLAFESQYPNHKFVLPLRNFDDSKAREEIWKYRDDWVHNKPPRVESIFYNPPRESCTFDVDKWAKEGIADQTPPPDYKWDDLIEKLKVALTDTGTFLNACNDEWESVYNLLR